MKRSRVTISEIAEYKNLVAAFYRAAQGKRNRPEVRRFEEKLDAQLVSLHHDLTSGAVSGRPHAQFSNS